MNAEISLQPMRRLPCGHEVRSEDVIKATLTLAPGAPPVSLDLCPLCTPTLLAASATTGPVNAPIRTAR